ncbi:MAG: hypothetical protein AAF320_01305 [Myxococcota bacterium]
MMKGKKIDCFLGAYLCLGLFFMLGGCGGQQNSPIASRPAQTGHSLRQIHTLLDVIPHVNANTLVIFVVFV